MKRRRSSGCAQNIRAATAAALLAPFRELAGDERFWNHTLDALAAFGAEGFFRVYRMQRPVAEMAVAADSFHLKPLLRIQQSADRFQVLALSRGKAKLFEGDRDVLDEIELDPAVPRIPEEAIGEERKQPHNSVWTYRAGAGVHHGQGGEKTPEVERETEKFFRAVDRATLGRHSRPPGLPLVLAALAEHQARFRALSRNPFLLADGIEAIPMRWTAASCAAARGARLERPTNVSMTAAPQRSTAADRPWLCHRESRASAHARSRRRPCACPTATARRRACRLAGAAREGTHEKHADTPFGSAARCSGRIHLPGERPDLDRSRVPVGGRARGSGGGRRCR